MVNRSVAEAPDAGAVTVMMASVALRDWMIVFAAGSEPYPAPSSVRRLAMVRRSV